jgi:hypothetical protein
MQSPLFVLLGVYKIFPKDGLSLLMENLRVDFEKEKINVRFTQKDKLLTAEMDEFRYYISYVENKDGLDEWFEMAENFKLKYDEKLIYLERLKRKSPLDIQGLNKRDSIYLATAPCIIAQMMKLQHVELFSFH